MAGFTTAYGNTRNDANLTTVYVSLHSADPAGTGANELASTLGYARILCAFGASASKVAANSAELVFTNSGGGDWAAATHVALWDASTAGVPRFEGALTTSRTCLDGGTLTFAIGSITVTLA